MQDGKALQAGTSLLGQNFSKAFDVKFNNRDGKLEHVWSTSQVSTRLMGALIVISDDQGLVYLLNLHLIKLLLFLFIRERKNLNS